MKIESNSYCDDFAAPGDKTTSPQMTQKAKQLLDKRIQFKLAVENHTKNRKQNIKQFTPSSSNGRYHL